MQIRQLVIFHSESQKRYVPYILLMAKFLPRAGQGRVSTEYLLHYIRADIVKLDNNHDGQHELESESTKNHEVRTGLGEVGRQAANTFHPRHFVIFNCFRKHHSTSTNFLFAD